MSSRSKKKTTTTKSGRARQIGRMGNAERVTISISRGLLQRVDAEAERLEVNRSAFITAALEDYMESTVSQMKFFRSPGIMRAMVDAFSKPGVMAAVAKSIGTEISEDQRQAVLDFMRQAGEESNG